MRESEPGLGPLSTLVRREGGRGEGSEEEEESREGVRKWEAAAGTGGVGVSSTTR